MIISVYQNNEKLNSLDLSELSSAEFNDELSFFIGRSNDCQVQLEDRKVSRQHCEIHKSSQGWHVKNLSSFSPIFINGKKMEESFLSTEDQVEIGPYRIIFHFDDLKEISNEENEPSKNQSSDEDNLDEPNQLKEKQPTEEIGESIEQLDDDTSQLDLSEDSIEGDDFSTNESEELEEDQFAERSTDDYSSEGEEYAEESYGEENYSEESYDDGGEYNQDEGEYSEEGASFDDDNYEMEESAGEKTQVFTGFADYDLEIFGEYAPYDRFSINDGETIIGRDESSVNICLRDSEVSSKHAKIVKTKISLRLVDLNSGNGTLLNGSRVNESDLQSGDEFIIGSTTFTVHIRSDMIANEKERMLPVEENQVIEVEEVVEVEESVGEESFQEEEEAPKSLIGKFKKLPPKKQKIYGAIGVLLLGMLLMDGEEEGPVTPNKKPKDQKTADAKSGAEKKKTVLNNLDKLTLQEREVVASKYQLAFEFIQQGRYSESLSELDYVMKLAPDYKQARSLYQMASEGLAKLEELEKKRIADIEAKKRQDKISKLLEKAQKYVKDRQVQAAEGMFSKILELDPENFDVPQLKLEIDAWKREQERIAMEKAQKDADRKRKIGQISPSRTFYGKEEWYKTILKVEEFLRIKNMDEDLVSEATKMLREAKANLKSKINPMIGKARSLKEGQDLKAAYEQYLEVLEHEPTNVEALDELNEIRDTLTLRSQKVYRDGLISESLMLYKEAKEKFQEVQQISPSDSEYYKKASLKLREYLE